jgi:hypothetical protein
VKMGKEQIFLPMVWTEKRNEAVRRRDCAVVLDCVCRIILLSCLIFPHLSLLELVSIS